MAGASTIVYAFSSVVSGQYEYKSASTSLTDKMCKITDCGLIAYQRI